MMHRWVGTDSGDQCYQCGLVLDYGARDDVTGAVDWSDARTDVECTAAHALAAECSGPTTGRAHHLVLEWSRSDDGLMAAGYVLQCAYGDARLRPDGTGYAGAAGECVGG